FVIVQSEFYVQGGDSALPGQADWKQALEREASYVVFNGRAFQYQDHPLQVDVGDRVRLFVVSAGPSFTSEFHIVGTVFNKVYPDGNPAHALSSVQTWGVPAGGGADRKSTRLNSSHAWTSYAVFCLKKRGAGQLLRHPAERRRQLLVDAQPGGGPDAPGDLFWRSRTQWQLGHRLPSCKPRAGPESSD